jgi:hypothetical protein
MGGKMATPENTLKTPTASRISWDTWAVLAAFLAAVLVRIGVIHRIPW